MPADVAVPAASTVAQRRGQVGDASRRLAWLAFCLTVVVSPWRAAILLAAHPLPPLYSGYTDLAPTLGDIAAVAALGLWALSLVAAPRRVGLGPAVVRWPALVLLAVAWASVPLSIDPFVSAHGAVELTLAAALGAYALNEVGDIRRLVAPIAAMVAVQAAVGLGQVATQGSLGLGALGELHLDPSVAGVSVVATSATDRLLRAYGLTDHPNILAGVLAFALPFLVLGLAGARRRTSALLAVVTGLGVVALELTFSRAGWLAVLAGLVVALAMLVRGGRRDAARSWLLAAVGAAVLAAVVAVPFVRYFAARVDVAGQQPVTEVMSTGERAILVDDASQVLLQHPIIGTGLGTLPLALMRADPGLTFDYQPAPVVLLDAAAELGLLGGVAYGALLLLPWVALARASRRSTVELAAASAALAAVTVVSFLDYYTWTFAPGLVWSWLLLGVWAGAYERATAPRPLAAVQPVMTSALPAAERASARA